MSACLPAHNSLLSINLILYMHNVNVICTESYPSLLPGRKLHQQFEMYKEQVKKMGDEAQQQQEQKGDAPTCGICHKTKFADGCGHNCSYCQTKFCARCGGRVSLRSSTVSH